MTNVGNLLVSRHLFVSPVRLGLLCLSPSLFFLSELFKKHAPRGPSDDYGESNQNDIAPMLFCI